MFFAAREEAKRRAEARRDREQKRQDSYRNEGYRQGREEGLGEGRVQGVAEGRGQERERVIKLLAKHGITLTPELVIDLYQAADCG